MKTAVAVGFNPECFVESLLLDCYLLYFVDFRKMLHLAEVSDINLDPIQWYQWRFAPLFRYCQKKYCWVDWN